MASIEQIKASDGSGNANVATVQNTRSPGSSTIIVDTILGINPDGFTGSMGTPHTFTDPITSESITVISEATAVDFTGHIDGSNIEIDDIAPGYTDDGSEVGDIVIVRPTTQWSDNVAETLEVSHDDDGTLKDGSVHSAAVLASDIVTTSKILVSNVTADKIATDSNILSYVDTTTGQSFNTTGPVDATSMSITFTTPASCTKILLRAEATISSDSGTASNTLSITNAANTVQAKRTIITGQSNASALQFISISRRISVTASTSYTFKLRVTNSAGTTILNQGNSVDSPTCLWVEKA
jgi:hypothetical protein